MRLAKRKIAIHAPLVKEGRVSKSLILDDDVVQGLENYARENGETLSAFVRPILKKELNRLNKK